jgi:DNA-binding MarR family transcriptional regulator
MKHRTLRLDTFMPYLLSVTSNAVSDTIAGAYSRLFGLKVPEWRVIAVLAEHDALTPIEIGQKTNMDKVTVSRAALGLLERHLVKRRNNPQDGRSHLLSLSADGEALYRQVVPQALALEARVLESLSSRERSQLADLLARVRSAADRLNC